MSFGAATNREKLSEAGLHPLAKCLYGVPHLGKLSWPIHLALQLRFLRGSSVVLLRECLASLLVFS